MVNLFALAVLHAAACLACDESGSSPTADPNLPAGLAWTEQLGSEYTDYSPARASYRAVARVGSSFSHAELDTLESSANRLIGFAQDLLTKIAGVEPPEACLTFSTASIDLIEAEIRLAEAYIQRVKDRRASRKTEIMRGTGLGGGSRVFRVAKMYGEAPQPETCSNDRMLPSRSRAFAARTPGDTSRGG